MFQGCLDGRSGEVLLPDWTGGVAGWAVLVRGGLCKWREGGAARREGEEKGSRMSWNDIVDLIAVQRVFCGLKGMKKKGFVFLCLWEMRRPML